MMHSNNDNVSLNCPHCINRSYASKKSLNDHLRKYHAALKDPSKTKLPTIDFLQIKTESVTPTKQQISPTKLKSSVSPQNKTSVIPNYESIPVNPVKIEDITKNCDKSVWSQADHVILLDQIRQQLPTNDHFKPQRMCDTLDWSRIKISDRTGEECKREWIKLSLKIRHYRTMTELVIDAKEYIQNPKALIYNQKGKHPDMPKKPLTPYFKFFIKKRAKYATKNPGLSTTDLTKLLSKKYSNLDESRKKKYVDAYNSEMELWKQAMIVFKQEHPEHNLDEKSALSCARSMNIPPKTISAMQIYINEKSATEIHNDQTKKQIYDHYKNKWINKLSDKKKIKFIRKAIEAKQIYDIEMAEYCANHPNFTPRPIKTFLNKAEQKLKDKFDGKPVKPPTNGYSLFTVETISQLTDIPNHERLSEISKKWKELPEHMRQAYNLKAEERYKEYKQELNAYLMRLPEDERRLVEADHEIINKKKSNMATGADRPMKPVAAVFLFIREKMDEYRTQYPNMLDAELRRMLVKEFNCLPDKDRSKYKLMEEAEKEKIAKDSNQHSSTNHKRKIFKEILPGEPTKPPTSGYQLFSKALLKELTEVKSSERLQEIGKRWAALTDQQKAEFNKKKDKLWIKYNKEIERFKKDLSAEELTSLENRLAMNQPRKKKKVPTATLR